MKKAVDGGGNLLPFFIQNNSPASTLIVKNNLNLQNSAFNKRLLESCFRIKKCFKKGRLCEVRSFFQ